MSYEHKREYLKEEHHVDKPTHEHEEKSTGLLSKIQQVGKAGLEKVEQIYEDIVGGGQTKQTEKQEHHVKVDVTLERSEEESLRESELYRSVMQENEEDLLHSAEKIEKSRSDVSDALDKMRSFAREADEIFRTGTDQLKQADAQMKQEADLVSNIMHDNEHILENVSQKLDSSAKRLRQEVNRIKAEELKRAAGELKFRAERLEQYAEETTTVAETLEQQGEKQQGQVKGHDKSKEGQYPAGYSAEAIQVHKGERKHEVKQQEGQQQHHEGIRHKVYEEGYPGQVPPKEYKEFESHGQQLSTEQLAKQPKQSYEKEKIQQQKNIF